MDVRLYVEDPNHRMPRKFLSADVYAQAIESFPIVCTDAVPISREHGTLYLAKRVIKPMEGWWIIGGRSFASEMPEDSVRRHFRQDTSLDIPPERFGFVCMNRYIWRDRQQEPQDVGSDCLGYTFAVELEPSELEIASANMNPQEYDTGVGLREFSLSQLMVEGVHQAVLDMYEKIFPVSGCPLELPGVPGGRVKPQVPRA